MNERAHCPYLGLRQNRAIRFAAPTAEHRCYVAGDAQEIPVDQRAYCLSGDHRTCPLYTGEWGATTSGAVGAGGTLALTRRGQRVRAAGRDTLFYLLVVSLVLTITAIWLGIGYLYTFGSGDVATAAASAPAVIIIPTTTPEPTTEPTDTATVIATPPAPQNPTAVLGADRVLLDWQPGPPLLTRGYNILRSDRARGPWIRLNGKLHTYSKYEDSGLEPNTQYFYRITTMDRNGRESEAARISVRTLASTPTPDPTPTPTSTPTPEPAPQFIAPVYIPPPTAVPPTAVPPTAVPPPTPEPATLEPSTPEPLPPEAPTAEQPTQETPSDPPAEPATTEPPTPEPPTPEPPTAEPPTTEPPTAEPPTPEPATPEPSSEQLPTAEPPTPEP